MKIITRSHSLLTREASRFSIEFGSSYKYLLSNGFKFIINPLVLIPQALKPEKKASSSNVRKLLNELALKTT